MEEVLSVWWLLFDLRHSKSELVRGLIDFDGIEHHLMWNGFVFEIRFDSHRSSSSQEVEVMIFECVTFLFHFFVFKKSRDRFGKIQIKKEINI